MTNNVGKSIDRITEMLEIVSETARKAGLEGGHYVGLLLAQAACVSCVVGITEERFAFHAKFAWEMAKAAYEADNVTREANDADGAKKVTH